MCAVVIMQKLRFYKLSGTVCLQLFLDCYHNQRKLNMYVSKRCWKREHCDLAGHSVHQDQNGHIQDSAGYQGGHPSGEGVYGRKGFCLYTVVRLLSEVNITACLMSIYCLMCPVGHDHHMIEQCTSLAWSKTLFTLKPSRMILHNWTWSKMTIYNKNVPQKNWLTSLHTWKGSMYIGACAHWVLHHL